MKWQAIREGLQPVMKGCLRAKPIAGLQDAAPARQHSGAAMELDALAANARCWRLLYPRSQFLYCFASPALRALQIGNRCLLELLPEH